MELTRFLGAHRYTWLQVLGQGHGCSWSLVRRDQDGARFLVQLWSPMPTDRDLEQIRDTFLARFLDATPLDPVIGHIGFDGEQAWYLQALQGTPLTRLWAGWGEAQRAELLHHLSSQLTQDPHPRCLHPELISFRPGLTQIPRSIGSAPWGLADLPGFLPVTAPAPALSEELPWTEPRLISQAMARPFRGRSQELPFLKSLVLGFNAPMPLERIVLLQGEEGLGKEHLSAWACAVAESEGVWVHHLRASAEESPGHLLGRLVEALLLGHEVDFYAARPEAAKALSLRVQAFNFLTGGRHVHRQESSPEPEELQAALVALDFASLQHPRLIHLSALDRAPSAVLGLVRELVHGSALPWLLSLTTGAQGAGLRPLIAQLRSESSAALLGLNRLEDEDLRLVLEDLLGRHDLPTAFIQDLLTQSLGNPGLLRNFLELAQQSGTLVWEQARWRLAPHQAPVLRAEEDLRRQVFLGRLQRLPAPSAALVRLLAMAERPLGIESLGSLLGLKDEAFEDALHGAVDSKLVQVQRGQAQIPDASWRELVFTHSPQPELKRLARALVLLIQEQGWVCPVALRSLAADEATALAEVLAAIGQGPPGPPLEVQHTVTQALQLKPTPRQEARLQEHLADAWAATTQPPVEGSRPLEEALAALSRALEALGRAPVDADVRPTEARLLRKRAELCLHLRRPAEAQEAILAAAERLKEHPLSPEQSRLRLVLGQLHLLQGHLTKGIRALEEGLQVQGQAKPQVRDQAALMLALGRAVTGQSQFLRAASLLQSAQRLLEHGQDFRGLVPVQLALAQVRLAQGQADTAVELLKEALQTSRMQGDPTLQARCHLGLGMVRSLQQLLGPALVHLDRAGALARRLGDPAQLTLIQVWRARTVAAMGDALAADHILMEVLSGQPPLLSPEELGDQLFLQAEVARFRSAWRDAARLFKAAGEHFETTGLLWRQRMAQLRFSQAVAREARQVQADAPEQGWAILENLKGPVEGADSRWLELEWHRAHALLLSTVPTTEAVAQEALQAWGEVQSAAREMRFPALVLEACAEGALLLLRRGEKLGARARIQDAFPSFQQLWSRLPEHQEAAFLGREDLHRFQQAVEAVGLRFVRPERIEPLQDWAPTQILPPAFSKPE